MSSSYFSHQSSQERLARFTEWASKSFPLFEVKKRHADVWLHNYQDSKDRKIALGAKCFSLGLSDQVVSEILEQRPDGVLGRILFEGKSQLMIPVQESGLTINAGVKKAGSLLTVGIASTIADSDSIKSFETALNEMIVKNFDDAVKSLRRYLKPLSAEQRSEVLSNTYHLTDRPAYLSRARDRLNRLRFDENVHICLSNGDFTFETTRKVSFGGNAMITQATATKLKNEVTARYEQNFNNLISAAGDLDLKLVKPETIKKLMEMNSQSMNAHMQQFKKDHYEKVAMAPLLEDPMFSQYHELFEARAISRKWHAYLGPTNSGKTHEAIQAMMGSQKAIYLAPLRLMALENQERLEASGVLCSLVTGEEQIIREGATHFCCTIEAFAQFSSTPWDVVVIDEAQMMTDPSRGWAWVSALVSAHTPNVYITGPKSMTQPLRMLSEMCKDELHIIEKERLSPLEVSEAPTSIKDLPNGSILVAFGRKDVLALKSVIESGGRSASVVYGALSPEVRREQARRFRDGESDILVATDAIGMGLNLPASTVCFYAEEKFDGQVFRHLTPQEVKQIAGRAGRFAMVEGGTVTGLDKTSLKAIRKAMSSSEPPIFVSKFDVRPNLSHLTMISKAIGSDRLIACWKVFIRNLAFGKSYQSSLPSEMANWISLIDKPAYSMALRWIFAGTAIKGGVSGSCATHVASWIESVAKNVQVNLPGNFGPCADLKTMEDELHVIEAYLSLSRSLPDSFPDVEGATLMRGALNGAINNHLSQKSHAIRRMSKFLTRGPQRCSSCRSVMPMDSAYSYCGSCWRSARSYDYY